MLIKNKLTLMMSIIILLCTACSNSKQTDTNAGDALPQKTKSVTKKLVVKVILGSTRQGRSSDKIGNALLRMGIHRSDLALEILDLRDFNLPFFDDSTPPASREKISDPVVKRWSDAVAQADAFIIVLPEYNSGYPGVLKNALDSLYKEWNNKPVAFVGYSGGPSGGSNAVAQMHQVALALQMIPVDVEIKIPTAWKAFDTKGVLVNQDIEQDLNKMLNQLVKAKTTVKK